MKRIAAWLPRMARRALSRRLGRVRSTPAGPLPAPAAASPAAPPAPQAGDEQCVLEKELLDRGAYEEKWRELFGQRQENYFAMHRRRYYELFNALAHSCPRGGRDALVLEIGVSEFLPLYRHFFPSLRLVTIDRPLASHGFDPAYCLERGGAERHYQVDLNVVALAPDFGAPPLGRFDYVVCTEVLEHLVVNPVEFLGSLLSLLQPEGLLYLTTPNFFRSENLDKIARRINPQMVYPRRGQNADAHHHFREYDMGELRAFVAEAGGRVVVSLYSDCWENGPPAGAVPREQRANLVLLAGRASAPPCG